MESLGLLVGHLIGDYIVQNDWMAANKTNPLAGSRPGSYHPIEGGGFRFVCDPDREPGWRESRQKSLTGHLACTVHCLCYTLAVWACSFWWMPMWGLAVCFLAHWPIDRFRLAGRWMRNVSGQKAFATGLLSPWSIIVVDNVAHVATLFVIGCIALK